MRKILFYLTISFVLGACSSGGTDDAPLANEVVNPNTINENADGSSANAASSDGASTDAEGSNEVSADAGSTEATVADVESTTGTPANGPAGPISQYGIVSQSFDEGVEFDAFFVSFQQQLDFSALAEEVRPTSDSCEFRSVEITGEVPESPTEVGGGLFDIISAGDVLTISSPAGSYAELLKNEQFGVVFYATDEGVALAEPVPADLSISIPGDQFPAFTNVPMPALVPLQVSSPANLNSITANTTFSWNASSNPDSFMEIGASSFSADFTQLVSVDCLAIDDGSFAFPADIQSQMGAFTGFGYISREVVNFVQSGSSLLVLTSSSELAF